jgi:tRNA pseudouridine55 synthase
LEQGFSGEYWQTPPMYSALKRNGVPLYKLARRGVVVEREPRKIHIEQLTLAPLAADVWEFSLTSSKGAYMRVFAADIGRALGCGGHLASLRRTAFGAFTLHEALPLDSVLASRLPEAALLTPTQAMRHYPVMRIAADVIAQLRRGQQAGLSALPHPNTAMTAALLDDEDELVAVVGWQDEHWSLLRVL